jgi:hypothetical protein
MPCILHFPMGYSSPYPRRHNSSLNALSSEKKVPPAQIGLICIVVSDRSKISLVARTLK